MQDLAKSFGAKSWGVLMVLPAMILPPFSSGVGARVGLTFVP
jgi:hypothetical protein